MKKNFNQCPICKEHRSLEHCSLATAERTVDGELQVLCCSDQAKRR